MILQGLMIVLVILICANFGVAVWNRLETPCVNNSEEYFDGAKNVSKSATKHLSTMQFEPRTKISEPVDDKNGYIIKQPHIAPTSPHVAEMIDELFTSPIENTRESIKDKHRSIAEFDVKMEGVKTRPSVSSAGTGDKVFSTIARNNTEREEYISNGRM